MATKLQIKHWDRNSKVPFKSTIWTRTDTSARLSKYRKCPIVCGGPSTQKEQLSKTNMLGLAPDG